jgi:uridine kinase
MTIDEIAADIAQRGGRGKPVLIGIEGYGGSGKTTFAQKLASRLGNAYVVSMDDFIVTEKLTEPSWDNGAFDRERLERQVLVPASNGQPVSYQRLVWATNTLSDLVTVPEVEYLIVEGISSYHPSIKPYYDYTIWVETPMEIAQQRGHARDGSNENAHYWDLWMRNDLAYQQRYHPEQRADSIFMNE